MNILPHVTNWRWRKFIGWLFLGCWLVVTFAAIAGMYQLWWQRERVLYAGKTVQEQRQTVFQKAGFPVSFVEKTAGLERRWPPFIHYTAHGDEATSLSYIKYLLIPRIPAGGTGYFVTVLGDTWSEVSGRAVGYGKETPSSTVNTPIGLFLSLVLVIGSGFLLRKLSGSTISWPETWALSCFFLTLLVVFSRLIFSSSSLGFLTFALVGLAGWFLSILSLKQYCQKDISVFGNTALFERRKEDWYYSGILMLVIVLLVVWSSIMAVIVVPDDWDAWALWASKAKILALGTGPLGDVTWFGHADYPLLWPVVWAFSGWLSGGWEEIWSRGWGSIFLALCVWEIVLTVRYSCKSLLAGLFAGALFVSIPNVPLITSWSYAEAPLWLMMICGLSCFLRWSETGKIREIILAALFAAAAAYTKNEGVLFALLLGCLIAVTARGRWKPIFLYGLVIILCYFPWWYWSRIYLDLGSHATAGLHVNGEGLQRAMHRLPAALGAIGHMWEDIRQWSCVGFAMALAMLWLPCLRNLSMVKFYYLLLPLGLLSGYLIIVLFSSAGIYWQVGTAWNRLTVQVMPLFIVLLVPLYWCYFRGDDG